MSIKGAVRRERGLVQAVVNFFLHEPGLSGVSRGEMCGRARVRFPAVTGEDFNCAAYLIIQSAREIIQQDRAEPVSLSVPGRRKPKRKRSVPAQSELPI